MAIFTMIAANMAAYNYQEPHPFMFRLYGSFAAPTFVLLSGLLVPYSQQKQTKSIGYFVKRGIFTLIIGASLDFFVWRLIPFTSFDVLYVIGISLLINQLVHRINLWIHGIVSICIIALTPVAQSMFGYADQPLEIMLDEGNAIENFSLGTITKNFLLEGWFPMFPWLGISMLGSFSGRFFFKMHTLKRERLFTSLGTMMLIAGVSLWIISNPNLLTRSGYSELFYPPKICYLSSFLGLIFILIGNIRRIVPEFLLQFFAVYGQSSLLMYILHSCFIAYYFTPTFGTQNFYGFLQLYFVHAFILWWIAKFVQLLRPELRNTPFLIRFITGT